MKRFITACMLLAMTALPALVSAATWNIDPDHTSVGFKIRHLMVSNVKGAFDRHSGVVDLDEKDITKSRVDVTIETASINTNVQKRDEHLRSADFFDVAKYPTMTFTSKKVAKGSNGQLNVAGDLTIRGITREVVLAVDPLSGESKDPWGNIRIGTSASAKINRKDFGLTWNKALETGGVVVGDEVFITLEIEMIKAKPK